MNFSSVHAVVAGMAAFCLFTGCAREHSKEAVYAPIPPSRKAPETQFTVQATGNAPLSYQWYISTNVYSNQWGQPFTLEVRTNPTIIYQWYKGTNSTEETQH